MNLNVLNGRSSDYLDSRHRALAYGDGLFETCWVQHGQIRFWDDHRQRLSEGAQRLALNWDADDQHRLESELTKVLPVSSKPLICKIMLLRQAPGRGYDFDPEQQRCDRLIQLTDYQQPAWQAEAARVVSSAVPASINPVLAGLKHLNRLDSVLARQSARVAGAHEALLALPSGFLVEGSMSNIFIKSGSQWQTPRLDQAGVNGIIRRRWLRLGSLIEADWLLEDLPKADGLVLGNALMGIVPVASVDNQAFVLPSPMELADLRNLIGLPSD
ncbi:aminodeoxychorismate lyase [Saccharospirillum sp. MSK14-1]|uniref:aminodeoxychorismate lyase n=1 Tax=Saccharospirillum sp. MSK14-1 TaxID=1897632 RepID=UPI000D378E04|nr:aminodeoxychorismate lyase [Saccharospirillum sp. MSK14-1]PTY36630.1 aminodeoxychorismate lyase [Saccharospirillum sp. MSK14-1]